MTGYLLGLGVGLLIGGGWTFWVLTREPPGRPPPRPYDWKRDGRR